MAPGQPLSHDIERALRFQTAEDASLYAKGNDSLPTLTIHEIVGFETNPVPLPPVKEREELRVLPWKQHVPHR
jgi:hypothetical protein